MQPVPFTTGKYAATLLLVGTGEIETRHVGTRIDIPLAQPDPVRTVRNRLEHSLFRINALVLLVHVCQFHGLADSDFTAADGLLIPSERLTGHRTHIQVVGSVSDNVEKRLDSINASAVSECPDIVHSLLCRFLLVSRPFCALAVMSCA